MTAGRWPHAHPVVHLTDSLHAPPRFAWRRAHFMHEQPHQAGLSTSVYYLSRAPERSIGTGQVVSRGRPLYRPYQAAQGAFFHALPVTLRDSLAIVGPEARAVDTAGAAGPPEGTHRGGG